jgi:poly(3-hydroxybutyrate) depolymerase
MLTNTLRFVIANYPVDEPMVIVTGFSGGGIASLII